MQINQTNNINFKGIYRLPLNRQDSDGVIKYIIPAFKTVMKIDVDYFVGENPYGYVSDKLISNLAKYLGGTKNWLKSNADLHNIDTSNFTNEALYVVTTQKDVKDLHKYMMRKGYYVMKFLSKEGRLDDGKLTDMIKQVFFKVPVLEDSNLPAHLKILKKILEFTKKNNDDFKKFAKDRIIDVESADELMVKLSRERDSIHI